MPVEKINHYKKTLRLAFSDEQTEQNFQQFQANRGRSTGIYALTALAVLNLTFAFLEHWILGLNSTIPLFAYLFIAGLSVVLVIYNAISRSTSALNLRILVPGIMTLAVLLCAIYLEEYRLYHAIEIALLIVWLGSLNVLSFRVSTILCLSAISIVSAVSFLFGATDLKLSGLLALMIAAYVLALYLSYMLERFRRMMFLTNGALLDLFSRQENWAYSLIDMDMSLSGILDFNELIRRLMEHIKTVIDYDSYVFTALEGKGRKPAADQIEGTLFEQEDRTLWPDDLLTKLSQTRQAFVSAQFETAKGFLGREQKNFQHYRMDLPIINDSTMVGVLSLRRESAAFDDLDMTASVSMATQGMMIFKRTAKTSLMSAGLQQATAASKAEKAPPKKTEAQKAASTASTDLDLTATGSTTASVTAPTEERSKHQHESVVPSEVVKKMQEESASGRKTITLLSRENAEHVAIDRYRTAAVEGEPLSLLLVEVDSLSSIREKDGDQAAYKVFSGIVKYVFSKTNQDSDVLGRYGQNGFSILLPKVDMNAAEKFAEALRVYTEGATFKTPYGERKATLSIGVASMTDDTGNHESMVRRADMALFVAKKNGRNCVKVRL